jgi:hypothetical protein
MNDPESADKIQNKLTAIQSLISEWERARDELSRQALEQHGVLVDKALDEQLRNAEGAIERLRQSQAALERRKLLWQGIDQIVADTNLSVEEATSKLASLKGRYRNLSQDVADRFEQAQVLIWKQAIQKVGEGNFEKPEQWKWELDAFERNNMLPESVGVFLREERSRAITALEQWQRIQKDAFEEEQRARAEPKARFRMDYEKYRERNLSDATLAAALASYALDKSDSELQAYLVQNKNFVDKALGGVIDVIPPPPPPPMPTFLIMGACLFCLIVGGLLSFFTQQYLCGADNPPSFCQSPVIAMVDESPIPIPTEAPLPTEEPAPTKAPERTEEPTAVPPTEEPTAVPPTEAPEPTEEPTAVPPTEEPTAVPPTETPEPTVAPQTAVDIAAAPLLPAPDTVTDSITGEGPVELEKLQEAIDDRYGAIFTSSTIDTNATLVLTDADPEIQVRRIFVQVARVCGATSESSLDALLLVGEPDARILDVCNKAQKPLAVIDLGIAAPSGASVYFVTSAEALSAQPEVKAYLLSAFLLPLNTVLDGFTRQDEAELAGKVTELDRLFASVDPPAPGTNCTSVSLRNADRFGVTDPNTRALAQFDLDKTVLSPNEGFTIRWEFNVNPCSLNPGSYIKVTSALNNTQLPITQQFFISYPLSDEQVYLILYMEAPPDSGTYDATFTLFDPDNNPISVTTPNGTNAFTTGPTPITVE